MRINIHSKMANRSIFFNIGIFLASLIMALVFAFGGKDVPETALVSPVFAFFVSAVFAGVASQRSAASFDIVRDGSALPFFLIAYIASGNTRPWLYAMLSLTVAWLVFIYLSKRHAEYDE